MNFIICFRRRQHAIHSLRPARGDACVDVYRTRHADLLSGFCLETYRWCGSCSFSQTLRRKIISTGGADGYFKKGCINIGPILNSYHRATSSWNRTDSLGTVRVGQHFQHRFLHQTPRTGYLNNVRIVLSDADWASSEEGGGCSKRIPKISIDQFRSIILRTINCVWGAPFQNAGVYRKPKCIAVRHDCNVCLFINLLYFLGNRSVALCDDQVYFYLRFRSMRVISDNNASCNWVREQEFRQVVHKH